jgi:hypothetical protein
MANPEKERITEKKLEAYAHNPSGCGEPPNSLMERHARSVPKHDDATRDCQHRE